MGLYQKRDQYLFACKVIRESGTPQPYEMVRGIDFKVPNVDVKDTGLLVTYESLQGSTIPSYTRRDLSNAITVLARGYDDNSEWGLALATLIGATSDAIKSLAMERHVVMGLNINSKVEHVPCERLIRINKSWSKISKSIRSGKYDFILKYKNEKGQEIAESVTKFSAGLILAIINTKDGSKEEKSARRLKTKDHGKRERDENEDKEDGGSKKSTGTKGGKKKRRKKNFPQSQHDSEIVAEETIGMEHNKHPSTLAVGPEEIKIESLQQTSNEFVKEEDSKIQKFIFPKIEAETDVEYLEKRYKYPPFDYSKAPKPFPVRAVPRNVHYSSDSYSSNSDSSDSESDSVSDPETKAIAEEDSKIQKFIFPKIEAETDVEYLEKRYKYPPFDYSKAPKPFPVRAIPRNVHYSSSSSYSSDSDSEAIEEEESEIWKKNSPEDTANELGFQPNAAPEEDKTPAFKEKRLVLDFDPETQVNKSVFVQVAKSSTVDLMSGPNVPASSILVKHGTERPAEAGDKDSKRAKTTQE